MTVVPRAAQEAIELARKGDLDAAIARGREAVDEHPGDAGLRAFMAMLHIRRNELADALPHLRAALSSAPADPFLTVELVRVLIGLSELDEAAAVMDRLHLPGTESLRLRAMLLQRRGEFIEAGKLYEQVVTSDRQDFESWGNLGICLLTSDRPNEAIAAFSQSLTLRPDRLSVRQKWVEAHFSAGTGEGALAELQAIARKDPSDANSCIAIAHLENLLGRPDESLAAIEQAIQRDESNADALVALAEAVEQRNDLERLESAVARLVALGRPVEKLPLLQARAAYRRGDYDQALLLARSAPKSADTGTRAQLIGQCLDRHGDPDGAFEAFVEMNNEDARTGSLTAGAAEESRASVVEQRSLLTREWIKGWPLIERRAIREPSFLVGFPRSGTTLLDTLLMGHPETAVAEEEPMLARVQRELGDLSRIAETESYEIEKLRGVYFSEAERHVPDLRTRLLIDKNPLAMGSQVIIHRLFPAAQIIFMERHPCDVVLSCFMTRFQPTGFGANFLTLEDTALLYNEMMRLWSKSAELLPLKIHRLRYERLVEDPEAELRPLAQFLGLEWLPELLDHRTTANRRKFIKTPSYAQVTEPVSNKPVGRWTRYRKQLEPVLAILEPWSNRMGYEL
jgi:tetratricopeptide (TPR) repeat protein